MIHTLFGTVFLPPSIVKWVTVRGLDEMSPEEMIAAMDEDDLAKMREVTSARACIGQCMREDSTHCIKNLRLDSTNISTVPAAGYKGKKSRKEHDSSSGTKRSPSTVWYAVMLRRDPS